MAKSITKRQDIQTTSAEFLVADPNTTLTLSLELEHGSNSEHSENQTSNEDAIRLLAHRKWEMAGFPAGDGFDFWLEAEREVNSKQDKS